MERILIIGCGGSGKSTLARALHKRLGLPVYHLDQLYWQQGWKEVAPAVFIQRLTAALAQPRWVIDGNYQRTLPQRVQRCDTLLYLDYSRLVCLWRVVRRVLSNHGRTRPDMPMGCPERIDAEFVWWVWTYRKTQRPRNLLLLDQARAQGVAVYVFPSPAACRRWLSTLPTP